LGTDRWNLVEELFHEVADLPPGEQATFLDRVCSGDDELRQEVESLLALDRPEDEFIRGVVEQAVEQLPPNQDEDSELIGQRIGRYLIIRLIGKGGMGAVYEAVREDDFHMQVAVKLLKRGTDTVTALSRFRSERQILAELQHPNIARLLDGGATERGLPYFVMEYVDGTPLLEYAAPLSVHHRLELFRAVCAAVHYAHQHRVVHRDIKPGNILLTRDGVPKLLDFGIAKLLDAEERSTTAPPTLAGVRLMTPDYASPEQVRGELVTAATDIYSLGAVLYELLTGQCALHLQTRSPSEIEKEICTREPKKPSALNKELDPDLDNIVLMAMRKDPARRYPSAEDLANDLDRFLNDLPVKARKDSVLYRTRKFLKRKRQVIAAATLPGILVLAYWALRPVPPKPKLHGSIVIADFVNKTGDPVFDDTLKQGLSVQLKQSPFLGLVSEGEVNETLKLIGRPAGDRLTSEIAREVCQRTGSEAMLAGSIAGLGSQYVIGLKAVNCNSGDVLAEAQEQASGKEAVLKALGNAAVSLRSKLGESLSSVQKYATPLAKATTPSLEALKAYSLAQKTWSAKGNTAALPFFKRAVEFDPNFAMAYISMAVVYGNLGQDGRATEKARKAYELRERVSERERFSIESIYYQLVTGEEDKAAQIYELWQQTYPRDFVPYVNLGGIYDILGNREKALEEYREAMRLEPKSLDSYLNLGGAYANLNQLDEAQAVYKQAEEHKLESEDLLASRYTLAFLKGDTAQMTQFASAAMGKPGTEDALLALQADTEAWYGRLSNARSLTRRAMYAAEHNDAKETAALHRAEAALREVESGNREQARTEADAAVKRILNREVKGMAALALARAGDTAGAEKLAAELDQRFPLGTVVQRYWLPTIRAAVALQRKDANRAIELLKVASEIELGYQGNLLPVYLRGEAYLMLHDGNAAAGEFQKFIEHYGLVSNFPWGALARLGLARAYALNAATDPAIRDKARTAYQEFLSLWKDADSDTPILKQAQAEYAKLQ
jgi:serine/threonine protein kinase/Tfp pilus assembly protein PilF